ncbi:MAG: hypothetical protein HY951_13870 [Bacteroidia bacterium]|nr:hypothetical protein [Bacteroidia bacterium]
MKKNRTLPIIAVSLTLLYILTGCAKKCEDFNEDIINWLPYKKTDNIILTNDNIKDTLTLKSNVINHTEKIKRNTKCACEDNYTLLLSSDSINISVFFNNSRVLNDSYVIINHEYLNYFEQQNYTYQLNGLIYGRVIIYKNNSQNSNKRFDRIVISRSYGIIEIIGIDENWILEDSSVKEIEFTSIDFNKIDC